MSVFTVVSTEAEMTLKTDLIAQPPTYVDNVIEGAADKNPNHFGSVFQLRGSAADLTYPSPGYKTPLFAAAETGARGDHMYGANVLATKMPGHPDSLVIGLEVNINNWGDKDCAPNEWPLMAAISVYAAGLHYSRAGVWVDAASPSGRVRNAIELPRTGYVDAAIRAGSPSGYHRATIVARQPDGDMSDAIIVERSQSGGTLFRARDEAGDNLFLLWASGSIWAKANIDTAGAISAADDVFSKGHRLVRIDEFEALKARVAALEARLGV